MQVDEKSVYLRRLRSHKNVVLRNNRERFHQKHVFQLKYCFLKII